jgi:hypothetical protein
MLDHKSITGEAPCLWNKQQFIYVWILLMLYNPVHSLLHTVSPREVQGASSPVQQSGSITKSQIKQSKDGIAAQMGIACLFLEKPISSSSCFNRSSFTSGSTCINAVTYLSAE